MEQSSKTGDLFLVNLISNNYKESQEYFNNLFEELSNNLLDIKNVKTDILDPNILEKIIKCLFYLKGTKINCFEKYL